ncbi:MAG: DUF1573 domain-containing protein [Bacteroidota bacterium]|jgi:hypothetical protein
MKQVFILFVAMMVGNGLFAQTKKADELAKFSSETVDLGTVKKGNPVTATFTLTNISKEDLVIENVTPGCGCTKSDYTKEPIKPGKTGTITATYNAANVGKFSKSVYVKFMGVEEQKSISIVGDVTE